MVEYAGLYFLLIRSIYISHKDKKELYKTAFIIAVLYAVSDEIHQTFTPTREGRIRDVVIDTVGITCAYLFISYHWKFVRKFM
jgi:VanZ family protein